MNELTTRDRDLTIPHDEFDAFKQMQPDELVLPLRKLVQGVTRDADAKQAGAFMDTLTKEYKPELLVAVLGFRRNRALFGESFDEPPLCTSDDAVTPREQVEIDDKVTGPTCARCYFSQWGTARGGKGKGQACRMTYNVICYDLDDGVPFLLRVGGASIRPFRDYFTAGAMDKTPAYAIETRIGSREQTFDSGKAYLLTFTRGLDLPEEITPMLRERAAQLSTTPIDVDEQPPEETPSFDY